nr:nuclear autoantigen Sp-100 isoform X1 [Misgurnus anguillicaudatus]
MDLGFFTDQKLLDIFCKNKTKISTISDPGMLLRHLKDNKIITEAHLESALVPENSDENVYKVLDYIEKRGAKYVRRFWKCVNKKHILERYLTISDLIQTLEQELPKYSPAGSHVVENVNEATERSNEREAREEPSTTFTETQRDFIPMDISQNPWDMPCNERWLPVQCGEIEGFLDREGLYKRKQKIIKIEEQLITPFQFEEMGGKGHVKNWKMSITCQGTQIKTLIERDILKVPPHEGKLVLRR